MICLISPSLTRVGSIDISDISRITASIQQGLELIYMMLIACLHGNGNTNLPHGCLAGKPMMVYFKYVCTRLPEYAQQSLKCAWPVCNYRLQLDNASIVTETAVDNLGEYIHINVTARNH